MTSHNNDAGPTATPDEAAGVAWWNGLSEPARAAWMLLADSAVPADAWALFKANPEQVLSVRVQEAREKPWAK